MNGELELADGSASAERIMLHSIEEDLVDLDVSYRARSESLVVGSMVGVQIGES